MTHHYPDLRRASDWFYYQDVAFVKSNSLPWQDHHLIVLRLFARLHDPYSYDGWGPFLESPGNFLGPKSNIQIQI